MGYNSVFLHTAHKFVKLLSNTPAKSISSQRCALWESTLLARNVVVTSDRVNQATGLIGQGQLHDYSDSIIPEKGHRVSAEPLEEAAALFVDGSS